MRLYKGTCPTLIVKDFYVTADLHLLDTTARKSEEKKRKSRYFSTALIPWLFFLHFCERRNGDSETWQRFLKEFSMI